jgi:Flp pilus assembly protein TadB
MVQPEPLSSPRPQRPPPSSGKRTYQHRLLAGMVALAIVLATVAVLSLAAFVVAASVVFAVLLLARVMMDRAATAKSRTSLAVSSSFRSLSRLPRRRDLPRELRSFAADASALPPLAEREQAALEKLLEEERVIAMAEEEEARATRLAIEGGPYLRDSSPKPRRFHFFLAWPVTAVAVLASVAALIVGFATNHHLLAIVAVILVWVVSRVLLTTLTYRVAFRAGGSLGRVRLQAKHREEAEGDRGNKDASSP